MYLLYASDVTWPEDAVPIPTDFMHQLSGRLPDDQLLDGPGLARRVTQLVDPGREAFPASP